ncbi:MAG TPA: hypothetical protein VN644_04415 [Pyrinomonadaceae bacterium]|jgi:hypothetical protein|nr:hypothetical protein [Pyrinomonadaceae bacterium]
MSYLKPSICAVLLVMTLSSTALAGNIVPRSGNITPSRSGNINPARSGNINPARTGNINPARTGNINPARDGIASVDSSLDRGRLGFTLLFQLLLESGLLF